MVKKTYKRKGVYLAALLWFWMLFQGPLTSPCFSEETESALERLLVTRERAVNLAYSGQLKEALEMISAIALELKDYPQVQADYIVILAWNGESKKAIEVYEQVSASMDLPAYVLPEVAKCYRTIGDYPKAISSYEQSLQENPGNAEAFLGLVYSLLESEQYGALEQELKQRIKQEPERKRWWSILSFIYAQQSRWDEFVEAAEIANSLQVEGLDEAEKIEQELKDGCDLYYAEIIKRARRGEYETSLEQLKKLRSIGRDDESLNMDTIIILSWNEVYEEAIQRFEQLPQTAELPDYLLKAMAPAYRAVGKFDQAAKLYTHLLKADPENQQILLVLFDMAMEQKNFSAADQYMSQLLERDPENIDFQLKRVDLLWRLNRAEEAVQLIGDSPALQKSEQALLLLKKGIDSIPEEKRKKIVSSIYQRDPAQGFSSFEMMMFLKQSETEAVSEQQLELLVSGQLARIQEYPEFLILDIADLLFANKEYEPAVKLYQQVLETAPQQSRALLGLARELFRDGKTDLALEHLELVLTNHPEDPQALFLKGEILESKKEYVKALQVYDTLQEIDVEQLPARNVEVRALLELGAYSLAAEKINSAEIDIDPELKRKAQGDLSKYQFLWNEAQAAQDSLHLNLQRYQRELKSQFSQRTDQVEVEPVEEITLDEESKRKALIQQTLNYVGDIVNNYGLEDFKEGAGSHYLRSIWDHILTLRLEKRMEELIQIYDRVVEMKLATPFWVREAAGDAYLYLQQPQKALELYQTVLEEKPKGHNIRMAFYHTYVELGRFKDAERIIEELDQDTPVQVWKRGLYRENWQKVEIAFNKAWFLMHQDRLEEAQEYLDQMMQKAPSNTNFRTAMAHLHLWRGWPRLALEDFRIIRTLNPELNTANNGYCLALREMGHEQEAEELLEELRAKYPKNKPLQRTEREFEIEEKRTLIVDVASTVENPGSDENLISVYLDQPINHDAKVYTNVIYRDTENGDEGDVLKRMYLGGILEDGVNWRLSGAVSSDYGDLGDDFGFLAEAALSPNDHLTLSSSYETEIYDIPLRSRAEGIDADELRASLRYRQSESFTATLAGAFRSYSDDNDNLSFSLRTDSALTTRAYWKTRLGTEVYAATNSDSDVAYFSPDYLYSVYLIPMVEHIWYQRYQTRIGHRLYAGYGWQKQKEYDAAGLWQLRYEQDYRLTDTFGFLMGVSYALKNYDGDNNKDVGLYLRLITNF